MFCLVVPRCSSTLSFEHPRQAMTSYYSTLFHDVPRCSTIFQYAQLASETCQVFIHFHAMPRCSSIFHDIPVHLLPFRDRPRYHSFPCYSAIFLDTPRYSGTLSRLPRQAVISFISIVFHDVPRASTLFQYTQSASKTGRPWCNTFHAIPRYSLIFHDTSVHSVSFQDRPRYYKFSHYSTIFCNIP